MTDQEILLKQWEVCVNMANSVSKRRDALNKLFATLHISILAFTTMVINSGHKIFIMCSIGVLACVAWVLLIRGLKILNEKKFIIIQRLEKSFLEKPFTKEQALLCETKKYLGNSIIEQYIPIAFAIMYIVIYCIL